MAVDALGLTILPDGCGERPPEWVRIGSFSPSSWVPADPPEPSDPEEVCPEFSHTGYCPDRLCERGCKHEAAWKVGDRVEHTVHGIGEVISTTHRSSATGPYCVRFDEGHHGWFEAGDIQEAPPVSDTVMVSVPRDLMDRLAATTTVDDTIGLIDALLYVCRAALTAEPKEGN